jgi:PAS domain S-box-containing protein
MDNNQQVSLEFINNKFESIQNSIYENAAVGIVITDLKGKILKANSEFCKMLGYDEDKIIDKLIKDLTYTEDQKKDVELFKLLKLGKINNYSIQKRYIKKNSNLIWTKIKISLIRDENNQPILALGFAEDISDQKDLEKRLIEESRFLEILMKSSSDSIYFKDLNSRFILVNDATVRKFGLRSADDIIGKTDFDLFSKEHAEKALQDEQEVIKTGKPKLSIIEKEVWDNKEVTWVSTSKLPIRDNRNEIVGTFGITRDITEQMRFEERLRESEERYKTLSDVTVEGVVIHDNGILLDANPAFLRMTGYELDELIGVNVIKKIIREDYQNLSDQKVKNQIYSPYEVVGVRKDGSTFYAEIEASKIVYKGKNVRVAAIRDITKRKKQELIQSALYKISELVNTSDDIGDLYKNIHEIIKTLMPANNFFIALFDKENDMLSFPYFVDEIDEPPPPQKAGRGLTKYIIRNDIDALIDAKKDLELREKGETELIGEPCKIWLGVRLKIKDNLIGAIVLQDYNNEKTYGEAEKDILIFVSEQIALAIDKKRNEEKLKKYSDELKELVASKDKFFSIVAHDLKSPFTALLGYSEVMANEYSEMSIEELGEFAVNMNDVAKKTYSLLENLLEWSRIQTGRMKYNPENLVLYQISQQVVDLFYDNAKKKGVVLKNRSNPIHEVFADSNMVFTMLRNLVSNAIKFTKDGDEVMILSKEDDAFIEVCVKDTGVGMNAEDLSKLFRIDVHHSEIGTEQEKGTGLGLILCKELAEKNGGKIWVQSKLNEGSEFFFTLPKPKMY